MIKAVSKTGFAAAALLALPDIAQAGTSTATSTASFNVVSQCSVTGATVNVGTFTTTNTWGDVFAVHGHIRETDRLEIPGSLGLTGVNWGSVTCDDATQYTLVISGRSTDGWSMIEFTVNGKKMRAWPMVKKVDSTDVPDAWWVNPGLGGDGTIGVAGVGNGAAQIVRGHLWFDPSWEVGPDFATTNDQLGAVGTYIAPIDYTLNF